MPLYEVIVVGLGAVGSAATWHLARLGTKVLGIDRYKPPHEFGSSTGETRLTRAAVGEGVEYSPLALRSNEIWREIGNHDRPNPLRPVWLPHYHRAPKQVDGPRCQQVLR